MAVGESAVASLVEEVPGAGASPPSLASGVGAASFASPWMSSEKRSIAAIVQNLKKTEEGDTRRVTVQNSTVYLAPILLYLSLIHI